MTKKRYTTIGQYLYVYQPDALVKLFPRKDMRWIKKIIGRRKCQITK